MKTRLALIIGLFGVHLMAAAAPAQEYEFYRVRTGESVETIAVSRGLKPEVLRQLNPGLENVVFPDEGTVIFVPPKSEAPRRQLASRSGREAPTSSRISGNQAAVAPCPPAMERSESKTAPLSTRSSGGGLSVQEIETIFDTVVKPHRGSVVEEVGESLALPSHQNVMITADGRTLAVPTAAPKRVKVAAKEDESDKHVSLSPRGHKVVRLLKESFRYLGVPYVWGGEDPSGMDCSGFTQKVFTDRGMYIPRTADLQFEVGQVVARGQEQPGDMVFFETYCPGASHVGIYVGHNQFVHASSGAGYITFGDLRDDYFARCYLGARRNW
ncbi:C40 family peptidase [bacterium]|nr:C40 family peptidase [bacterium]